MSNNFISKISRIVTESESEYNHTLSDIDFAIDKMNEMLNTEKVRKKLYEKELIKKQTSNNIATYTKTSYEIETLNTHLLTIEINIKNLEDVINILKTKKEFKEFEKRNNMTNIKFENSSYII